MFSTLVVSRLLRDRHARPAAAPVGAGERVLIAPANSAGQGFAWARALERARPQTRVTAMQFVHEEDRFSYPSDLPVLNGFAVHSGRWQRAQRRALGGYRAVLLESAMPVLGGSYDSDVIQQIEVLRADGVHVALLFHGSDLRDPDAHLEIEPLSYFAADAAFTEAMRRRVEQSRRVIAQTGLPVFVSTPDLLHEIEGSTWLPVVVDIDAWQGGVEPLSTDRPPQVLHAPSSSHIKGSELIEPVLQRLHNEGMIEYRSIRGIPHEQMPDLVRAADIVVDQMRGGPYGVAACEAMAAGRVVVSHVRDEVRDRTESASGLELPIVEAVPDNLEEVIRQVIAFPRKSQEIAGRGAAFVRHWHDGKRSGRVLAEWLQASAPSGHDEVNKEQQ